MAYAVESSNDAIITRTTNGIITSWNRGSERLYGFSASEVMGKSISFLTPSCPFDEMPKILEQINHLDSIPYCETTRRRKDGQIIYVSESLSPVRDKQGQIIGTCTIDRDITEEVMARKKVNDESRQHKLLEMELVGSKEIAEVRAQTKSDFMANMSHEIRTPMNAIIGMTSLLLDDDDLTEEQKDFIETIKINGDALIHLINDILDFSKMENKKTVLEEQPFEMREFVEETLDLVAACARKNGLNLDYIVDKGIPAIVIGDSTKLRQILGNLLSNAVKFTKSGAVSLIVSAQKSDSNPEIGTIHFAVRDTGIGIPQDFMDQIFQPYSQSDASVSRNYGGTGLGLAISKKLVELMDGKIWVESEAGVGSTFHFTIKAIAVPIEPDEKLIGVQPQLVGKRILIINNDNVDLRVLKAFAHSWGMVPLVAFSCQDALQRIQRKDNFDIAILGTDATGMMGETMARGIREYNTSLPLVMLTTKVERANPDIFAAQLANPIEPSQLLEVLEANIPSRLDQMLARQRIKSDRRISSRRILLAEDNFSSQKVILQMLARLGYEADVAVSGKEVLQALENRPYDLVLMDVRMPEMSGLEATRIIRQRWPEKKLRIIAVTALALQGDREKCLAAGMDGYISKPLKIGDLAEQLRRTWPQDET